MAEHDSQQMFIDEVVLEAHTYLTPLVMMELTRRQMTNVAEPTPFQSPMGSFAHMRTFPPGDFKGVVRPNFDTLYSVAWFDVSESPYAVTVPAAEDYVMLPVLDMWTDVVAVPGVRSNGSEPFTFAVCNERWSGSLPEEILRVDVPTSQCWIIGRVATTSPTEFSEAHRFQDGLQSAPLFPDQVMPREVDPTVDMRTSPLRQLRNLSGEEFFRLGLGLLSRHGPRVTDCSIISRMDRIGLAASENFAFDELSPEVRASIEAVAPRSAALIQTTTLSMANIVNGWQMNLDGMGVYGNDYARRAVVALRALGANPAEEAVYPNLLVDAEGSALAGENTYVVHFDAVSLPPVDAFWSLAAYDAKGFTVRNDLDRYSLGDRSPLAYGPDGSLDIVMSHEPPSTGPIDNWLPLPEGPVAVMLRLYLPQRSVLEGQWRPPAVVRAAAS